MQTNTSYLSVTTKGILKIGKEFGGSNNRFFCIYYFPFIGEIHVVAQFTPICKFL